MAREATAQRKTSETDISLRLNLDGKGSYQIDTGIPFLDHMLELMTRHGLFDLTVKASGDVEVDFHHTVEDIGIVLGNAFKQSLGDCQGIRRYGFAAIPMDEVLAHVAVDLSMRPVLVYQVPVRRGKVGTFDVELVKEFFQALAHAAGMTIHINVLYGANRHHIIEAMFKAAGRALSEAVSHDPRIQGVMSTKGTL